MTVTQRWLLALWIFILIAAFAAPRLSRPVHAAAQSATAAGQPAQPSEQAYNLPPDKLAKAVALSRTFNILDIAAQLWALALIWLLLASRTAAGLAAWAETVSRHGWLQGMIFFATLVVLFFAVFFLPVAAFGHHTTLSYGISVQGWGRWMGDQAKVLVLLLIILTPTLLLFNWIVRRWPRRYWLSAWVATLPILVLLIFVEPLLEPVFNKFEPLTKSNAALVAELEKVVVRTGTDIPSDRMFLMNASAKTNGLNAYVSGIGATKRIVVWDTTAGRIPNDEVQFIFGHESGHYVLNHIPKIIVGIAIILFFTYAACAWFAGWLMHRFGERWRINGISSRAGFVVLIFAFQLAQFVLEPVNNTFSRYYEHEADVYGQEAMHGLVPDPQHTAVASFNALGEAWLEDPNPSPLIEFWEYDHPAVQTRANFAAHYDPWANGGRGKFFDK